jgi:hypothetical protein
MIEGRLYRYNDRLQAFESPVHHSSSNYVVYLGGLTDGLLACAYVDKLAKEVTSLSLVFRCFSLLERASPRFSPLLVAFLLLRIPAPPLFLAPF